MISYRYFTSVGRSAQVCVSCQLSLSPPKSLELTAHNGLVTGLSVVSSTGCPRVNSRRVTRASCSDTRHQRGSSCDTFAYQVASIPYLIVSSHLIVSSYIIVSSYLISAYISAYRSQDRDFLDLSHFNKLRVSEIPRAREQGVAVLILRYERTTLALLLSHQLNSPSTITPYILPLLTGMQTYQLLSLVI